MRVTSHNKPVVTSKCTENPLQHTKVVNTTTIVNNHSLIFKFMWRTPQKMTEYFLYHNHNNFNWTNVHSKSTMLLARNDGIHLKNWIRKTINICKIRLLIIKIKDYTLDSKYMKRITLHIKERPCCLIILLPARLISIYTT